MCSLFFVHYDLLEIEFPSLEMPYSGLLLLSFNFYVTIYAHVPLYFLENIVPLPTVINLGTEHLPLAILPTLDKEVVSDILMEEAEEDNVNEREDTGKGNNSKV